MAFDTVQFPLTKGVDQSVVSLKADLASLYQLHHFRQDDNQRGKLTQIPYCTSTQLSAGTYWDGAAGATEPTDSSLRLIASNDMYMTSYVHKLTSGTQPQAFYQTTVPAAETIYTGCRLVINTITGLAITLGSTLDVEVEVGGTTIKWRKNGGIYTTGVAISTTGVSIDGGNATLYFLASSGFTAGDVWSWTRLDRAYSATTNVVARPAEYMYYKSNLYFTATDDRLMMLANAVTSSQRYVISVGYRPVYASYFTFFDDHLVVAGYYTSTVQFFSALRNTRIAWSDKTDVHNFIATDLNEADTYTLPNVTQIDATPTNTSQSIIVGITVQQQRCFVFTFNEIYQTAALGLPLVFSWTKYMDVAISGTVGGTVSPVTQAPNGVFLRTTTDVVFFDGNSLQSMARPVFNTMGSPTYGAFLKNRNEVAFISSQVAYILQLQYGTWYTRAVAFDAASPTCIGIGSSVFVFGAGSRKIFSEDSQWANQLAFDTTNGTAYATPKITTQLVGGKLQTVKESRTTYVGALITTVSSTYQSTAADCQLKLHWYLSVDGTISGSPATDAAAVWINTNSDGMIPYPREPFRALALEVQVVGLVAGKPPGQVTLTDLSTEVYVNSEVKK
jgi:hypothetical protein